MERQILIFIQKLKALKLHCNTDLCTYADDASTFMDDGICADNVGTLMPGLIVRNKIRVI